VRGEDAFDLGSMYEPLLVGFSTPPSSILQSQLPVQPTAGLSVIGVNATCPLQIGSGSRQCFHGALLNKLQYVF
jgi:hypothetical protein